MGTCWDAFWAWMDFKLSTDEMLKKIREREPVRFEEYHPLPPGFDRDVVWNHKEEGGEA